MKLAFFYYYTLYLWHIGGLAHLARVLAWQARGDRFESGILHKIETQVEKLEFFYAYILILNKKIFQFIQFLMQFSIRITNPL